MLNRNLDLDIDNYVSVDFGAVAKAIDVLGGVDIEIESEKELGYLNDYILANNDILDESADTIDSVGKHTLNGVQAVAYARIRYTAGGDFKRAERQRRVFSEMMSKAKDANLSQINQLIEAVFPDIQTDLTMKELLDMASVMLDYDLAYSSGFPYDKTTDEPSRKVGSVDVPCTLESNVIELHRQLFGTEDYQPSELVQEYSDYIINNTGLTEEDAVTDEFSEKDDFTGGGSGEDTSADSSSSEATKNDKVVYLSKMRLDQNCVQKSKCGMPEMHGKCTDASGKAGLRTIYEDVCTGKTGLCRQLDVYTQESLTD